MDGHHRDDPQGIGGAGVERDPRVSECDQESACCPACDDPYLRTAHEAQLGQPQSVGRRNAALPDADADPRRAPSQGHHELPQREIR
jgi:hypothetical protein